MSSIKDIDIRYDDLISKYDEVLKYAAKNADSFSVISNLKKSHDKTIGFEHSEKMSRFEPFLEKNIVGIKEWPGTITRSNKKIMLIYRLCKDSRAILKEMPNMFLPLDFDLPEDICFYRNQNPWLVTISHERIAYVLDATKEDIRFFQQNGICFF